MSKIKFILICLLVLVTTSSTSSQFSTPKLFAMNQRLNQFVKPYGEKIGLCFIDLETGAELQINGMEYFPTASVAKVPIMATVFHLAESGQLNLNKKIMFKEKDKLPGSGVLRWMKANREYSVKNLTRLMIVLSDNTATKLVADYLGKEKVNAYMRKLGITNTKLVDNSMLVEAPSNPRNLTTPYDMARLCAMLDDRKYFQVQSSEQMLDYMKRQKYRWGIWKGVPKGTKIANKTGNLTKVLNDVGVVYSPKGNYIISVFTHGFSTKKEARKIINEVSKIVYDSYTGSGAAVKIRSGS